MAEKLSVGPTTPCDDVEDCYRGSRVSGSSGDDITLENTFEMSQFSQAGSLSSCAPLSKDQQYIRTVAHVDFTKALLAQKPTPWTKPMLKLYCYLFVAFLNSIINGYDGSIMGGINAMSTYQRYFNMKTTGSSTGIVFAIYSIGHFFGCFICGPLTDSWGRRWGMFSGALTVIIGTCVQALSTTHAWFMGGRFILGLGAAILTTAGPVYVAEMAHPAWRGTLTGLYNSFYCVGGIAATWTMYRTQNWASDLSWRLPIWLQAVASGTVLLLCLWCPETPRWLVSNDRSEEAIRVLTTYHGDGNRKSPLVLLSYKEMLEEIVLSGSDKRWWDYSELFNSTSARWRMVCVAGMAFFGQWSGNGAVTHFLPVLLDNVGIRAEATQLLHYAVLTAVSFGAAIVGSLLVDRVGRRVVLMIGTGLFIVWWTVITILASHYGKESNTNTAGSKATIAFIYLFGITYSFSYTPLQVLYPVECLKYETRAKGMGVFAFFTNIATLFNSYGTSVIIEKISWGFCFLYIAWDILELIVIYLFFVETRSRTLEEINEIFKDPMPRNKSLQKHVILVTQNGILYQGPEGYQQNLESPLPPSEQKF
ncbi:hypothetical protein C7212DRAFT_361116 [Tuber magnatum]|uniref:Major facilitator superfamily (MFS) profile domain-containing protein n=1 Tax=Tuber magnatum TaxID=42249 RepID=A0A317T089_9PEZI|nr:hypothetical protein C7212DRAFT_361116 [Tuber magnatum]